jgi:hypothetical protein
MDIGAAEQPLSEPSLEGGEEAPETKDAPAKKPAKAKAAAKETESKAEAESPEAGTKETA